MSRRAKVAIVLWFHTDLGAVRNRLDHLRQMNPGTPIYGLYGGDPDQAPEWRSALPRLDDFWSFPEKRSGEWKWRHCDLVVLAWYLDRGHALDWDTVYLNQGDFLTTRPLAKFLDLAVDDIVLSGVRPVAEVEEWWPWVTGDNREEYVSFLEMVRSRYGFREEPKCCLFLVACLPRSFLERFAAVDDPQLGMNEYKLPIYAEAFGHRFVSDPRFEPWWAADPGTRNASRRVRSLNAVKEEVQLSTVLRCRDRVVFHPYYGIYPFDLVWAWRYGMQYLGIRLRARFSR